METCEHNDFTRAYWMTAKLPVVQGRDSLIDKTPNHQIMCILNATRLGVEMVVLLCTFTSALAALLPIHLSNLRAIKQTQTHIAASRYREILVTKVPGSIWKSPLFTSLIQPLTFGSGLTWPRFQGISVKPAPWAPRFTIICGLRHVCITCTITDKDRHNYCCLCRFKSSDITIYTRLGCHPSQAN